jgi:hypothetical protein
MKNETSGKWLISICGLNCTKCDIYQAGHGDEKLQEEIVEWFKKERNKGIKPEQVRCEGCRGPLDAHWSEDCKMMQCATKKGLAYCFQCGEFPCTTLDQFSTDGAPHHKRTVENLKKMKETGIDAWTAEQKIKGQCLFCP